MGIVLDLLVRTWKNICFILSLEEMEKNRKFYEFISEDSFGQLWYVDDGNEVPKRIPTKYDRYNEGESGFLMVKSLVKRLSIYKIIQVI